MIFRLLTNANYLIYFFCIFVILILLTYLIYKVFIVENDLFILNEKINKIELEFNNPNLNTNANSNSTSIKDNFNLSDIIMNEVFNNNNHQCNSKGVCKVSTNEQPDEIDIDNIIDKQDVVEEKAKDKDEILFDLKKEIIVDDKEGSVISENNIKRKLQKLNLDKLKEKCGELNLSTEGTKAQLINRILEES